MKFKVVEPAPDPSQAVELRFGRTADGLTTVEARKPPSTLWKHIVVFREDGTVVIDAYKHGARMNLKFVEGTTNW